MAARNYLEPHPYMDLRRLKHLVALADTRNFGRAAAQCHISQSAFSRSIQSAEEELRLQLFDRGTLEVKCTDAGAFVVERARRLLFENHCLERDVNLYRERQIGDLAIGTGPYPAATMLQPLLTEIRTRYPQVNLRVEVNNTQYLLEHLRLEELDLYVADLRNIPQANDLDVVLINQAPAGFFVRAGHPLLAAHGVRLSDLLRYGVACVRLPDEVALGLGARAGLPAGQRFPLALECDDLNLLKHIALTSDTVLAFPVSSAQADVDSGLLTPLVVIDFPKLSANVGIVSLKGRSLSLMAQFAVDFLTDMAKAETQKETAAAP